jgi:formylglycine-generating enzyme required for sulfatase activity
VTPLQMIDLPGGTFEIAPSDWETSGAMRARQQRIAPFAIDSIEVTLERWQECAEAGACRPLPVEEPGLPVRGISPADAQKYCRLLGGRLPTSDEWMWAAAGHASRRFPWGQTGLVCRRAVFGLVDGPCGRGATGPDGAGMRPDGATPEGILDLSGNVAEWTVDPDGRYVARGGSYRSKVAADLRSWAAESADQAAGHIGFRCAYDRLPPPPLP